MALQGTIETFALPDVMRLLASTKKTGRLRLSGGRGTGSVWLDGGSVVAAEASGASVAAAPVEVVFELLRFKDGDFVFEGEEAPAEPGEPAEVEPLLAEAEALLEEWKGIEQVVPSLESWVSLAADLPSDEVTIDRARWGLIVALGGGSTVAALGESLSLGELAVSRTVKELVEASLVTVGDAPATTAARTPEAPVERSQPALDAPERETTPPPLRAVDGEGGADRYEPFDPSGLVVEDGPIRDEVGEESQGATAAPEQAAGTAAASAEPLDEPADAAEIARQLANLSPKAAKAVAAAAKASTPEERDRALAEVESEDINRELLLRFLGSVNG